MTDIRQAENIKIDLLVPNENNPNKMSDKQLVKLCEDILKFGFNQPIKVARRKDGKFNIVAGHHRYKAAMQLGWDEVPCVIYDMSEIEQALDMARNNIVTGKMDPIKFMDLFDKLAPEFGEEVLEEMMGFADSGALEEIKRQLKKSLPKPVAAKLAAMEKEKETTSVEELTKVVADIMTEYGETVPSNFVHFTQGSKNHVMQRTDEALWGELRKMYQAIEAEGLDSVQVFKVLIKGWEDLVLRRKNRKKGKSQDAEEGSE